jgi:uncharacterized protein YbjQ (UPF0145 family)
VSFIDNPHMSMTQENRPLVSAAHPPDETYQNSGRISKQTRTKKGWVQMILTTTPSIEGKPIQQYFGVVAGEAIMGANIVRDMLAGLTDVIGGRSGAYEEKLAQARRISLQEMGEEARRMGANAVVGIDLDYEVIREGMLMVTASGTAVRI